MAGSVNKVILVGNLGRDPEVRNTQDGSKIVNLALATSDTWNDRQTGERKERTEWHRVVIFNDRVADVAERFLKKGAKIYVEGALQTRKWTDQGGQERYTTEVVIGRFNGQLTMLDRAGDSAAVLRRHVGAADGRCRSGTGTCASCASGGGRTQCRWGAVMGCATRRRSGRRNSFLTRCHETHVVSRSSPIGRHVRATEYTSSSSIRPCATNFSRGRDDRRPIGLFGWIAL